MKRFIFIAVSAMLIVSLVGCTENKDYFEMSVQSNNNSQFNESSVFSAKETDGKTTVQNEESSQTEGDLLITQSEEQDIKHETSQPQNQAEQEFININAEISKGTVRICSGDSFSVECNNGSDADYQITDNTLYLKNNSAKEVKLTLPEERYEDLTLTAKNGHIYVESSLNVKALSLDMEKGDANLDNIFVSDSSSIIVEEGTASLCGDLGIVVTASCKNGQLNLKLPFDQSDSSYELELYEGDISLGQKHYHGKNESQTIDNDGNRLIKLSSSHGDISVEFEK